VAASAEHGEEGIPDGALQGAARQPSIGFHVADLGLDGAAAAEVGDQFWCEAATGSNASLRAANRRSVRPRGRQS
jgi:hypothetical protein